MPISTQRIPGEDILSINELIRVRVEEDPDFEVLGVPDKNFNITRYSFKEVDESATRLATHLVRSGLIPCREKGDATSKKQVALLAPSGIEYLYYELALSRMGYCVLFVSINNSPAAVAHLLNVTESTHLIYHSIYAETSEASTQFLPEGHKGIKLVPCVDPSVFSGPSKVPAPKWDYPLTMKEEQDLPAFIVHSSGSTGFPKPIMLSHAKSLKNFGGNFNMTGMTTLPLYHNHGHSCLYRAFCSKKIVYLFPASTLPLTTSNILNLLNAPGVDVEAVFGVPFAYKLLAEDPSGIEKLKTMKLCLFGGSPMGTELGDRLVAEGVKLAGHFGSTEMGQLCTSLRDYDNDKEWSYMRIGGKYGVKGVEDFIELEPVGDGTYELIVLDGWKTKVMSNRPNGSYATSDCFIKHPTIPNAIKFMGRLDDTLVMVNGEKTNPVPMEGALRNSPYVTEAIVFGAGRSQTGVLIILGEGVDSTLPRAELLKLLQPALDAANESAPSHSQLSPDTIVILPFGTVLPRTDKGSSIRKRVYKEFEAIIDGVYKALEGEDDSVEKVAVGSVAEVAARIAEITMCVAGGDNSKLTNNTDLFDYGLDSLKATRIRNNIQREMDLKGKKLNTNFVFDHPSINKMSEYLVALVTGDVSKLKVESPQEIMLDLVAKYSKFVAPSTPRRTNPSKEIVVLSGATGSLGAYTLSQLLEDPSVKTVYCLCRAKNDEDATKRVEESLRIRGLDTALGGRVVCFATDFGSEYLGMKKVKYDRIAAHATLIIHNAWSVNFNLDITSFEVHIRGAYNLITLALSVPHQPADFYFASSVSAVFAWPGPYEVPEAVTADPNVAQAMGYAKSKWVTEKICQIATTTTQVNAGVLRIGQMVGDTEKGIWNETEAISLIFKSADIIHTLPDLDDQPSWLPVDYAAKTILEVAAVPPPSTVTDCACWHIVQPNLVKWSDILESFHKAGLKFDAVPRKKWVKLLRESPDDFVKNPTKKLLSFFEGKYDIDDTIFTKRYPLSTKKTQEASEALRTVPTAGDDLVAKWFNAWRKTGFLN